MYPQPIGDYKNLMSAADGVDLCLGAFGNAMGAMQGALRERRLNTAYEAAVNAHTQLTRDYRSVVSWAHEFAAERDQLKAQNKWLMAKVEAVRDVRLDLARVQMEIDRLKAQLAERR